MELNLIEKNINKISNIILFIYIFNYYLYKY